MFLEDLFIYTCALGLVGFGTLVAKAIHRLGGKS